MGAKVCFLLIPSDTVLLRGNEIVKSNMVKLDFTVC